MGKIVEKGILLREGQAPVPSIIDKIDKNVENGEIILDDTITHRLSLNDVAKGYEIFDKKEHGCLKII